jgi:hypothetical protein
MSLSSKSFDRRFSRNLLRPRSVSNSQVSFHLARTRDIFEKKKKSPRISHQLVVSLSVLKDSASSFLTVGAASVKSPERPKDRQRQVSHDGSSPRPARVCVLQDLPDINPGRAPLPSASPSSSPSSLSHHVKLVFYPLRCLLRGSSSGYRCTTVSHPFPHPRSRRPSRLSSGCGRPRLGCRR